MKTVYSEKSFNSYDSCRVPADDSKSTLKALGMLFDLIAMRPEKNLLLRLTVSLKRAILSMALDRYNANKLMICNVLGLSKSQFDEEMRSSGLSW